MLAAKHELWHYHQRRDQHDPQRNDKRSWHADPFDGGVKQQFQRCANRGSQSVMVITKRLSLLSVYRPLSRGSSRWLVCNLGLEGIVSKRLTSVYKSGLSNTW